MPDDDEIIIVEDDTGEGAEHPAQDLKAQFEEIKRQADASRERADAAERRASDAQRDAAAAQRRAADGDVAAIDAALAQAKAEADSAQAEMTAAAEAGDFKKLSEASRRMGRAEAAIGQLEDGKHHAEAARITTPRGAPNDPVEAYIAQRRGEPEVQRWLRDHPEEARELATNPQGRRAQKITAADADARGEGLRIGSPEYFQHVERYLGMGATTTTNGSGRRNDGNDNGSNGSAQARRQAPPAAPVNSGQASGRLNGGGTEVRLSPGEVESATDGSVVWNVGATDPKTGKPIDRNDPRIGQPIGTREFARRKLAMQKEGFYDRGA